MVDLVDLPGKKYVQANRMVEEVQATHEVVRANITEENAKYKIAVDKHRRKKLFQVGDEGAKGNAAKRYREDSNEAACAVVAVEKIFIHESLTSNDIVACEVISKWKAILKEDMDVQSDVYVLSNGYRKSSDNSHDYY
nr:zinc finger, CCHC-type [Tanacetum cinerariifolium]